MTQSTSNRILQTGVDTRLAARHASVGAKMGVWFGCSLPDDFGDPAAEFRAARDSVALIDKSYRTHLSFTGPDRVRYLNAILTNNIKGLTPGNGTVSLLLNAQGHILAEIETYAEPEKLFCISYNSIRESLIASLDKYIIMDDVTLLDETDRFCTIALEGPKTAAIVQELSGTNLASLGELSFVDDFVNSSIPCRLTRRSPGGVPGAEFLVENDNILLLWKILEDAARKNGGRPIGYSALSATRLTQGIPWFGYDFGDKQIPHEAGLENSHISYTKGCYTGQEIVERVRSRGQVNRRRVLLTFNGNSIPEAGAILTSDGNEVGYVTRAARAWDLDRILGMGYVRKGANAPGTILNWSSGTAILAPL